MHLGLGVRGVNSVKVPDSSIGGVPMVNCLGVDHMEEEVQVKFQMEVEREEQKVRETQGKEQSEEQRKQTLKQPHTWETM